MSTFLNRLPHGVLEASCLILLEFAGSYLSICLFSFFSFLSLSLHAETSRLLSRFRLPFDPPKGPVLSFYLGCSVLFCTHPLFLYSSFPPCKSFTRFGHFFLHCIELVFVRGIKRPCQFFRTIFAPYPHPIPFATHALFRHNCGFFLLISFLLFRKQPPALSCSSANNNCYLDALIFFALRLFYHRALPRRLLFPLFPQ